MNSNLQVHRLQLYSGFGLLLVFLVLAAQYESWALPGSVILAVPFGVIGALLATWMRGIRQRRLLPNRYAGHDWLGGEERYFDC